MSVDYNWYIEKKVILGRVSGIVTTEMADEVNLYLNALLNAGDPPVHYINDVTQVENFNINATKLPNMMDFIKHPNLGWTVIVGANQLIKVVGNIFMGVANMKFKTADTLEEAMQILRNVDNSLRETL